jgi:hypothetical protein
MDTDKQVRGFAPIEAKAQVSKNSLYFHPVVEIPIHIGQPPADKNQIISHFMA